MFIWEFFFIKACTSWLFAWFWSLCVNASFWIQFCVCASPSGYIASDVEFWLFKSDEYWNVGLLSQKKKQVCFIRSKKIRRLRIWSLNSPIEMTEFNSPIINWDMGLSKIGFLGFRDFLAPFLTFLPRFYPLWQNLWPN